MKNIFKLALCIFPMVFFAQATALCPMHEDDIHFIHYRELMIGGAVYEIDSIVQDLSQRDKLTVIEENNLHRLINTIRFNLGIEDLTN